MGIECAADRRPRTLARAPGRIAWGIALLATALAAWATLLTHSPMPYEDEWASLGLFRDFVAAPSLAKLASLHNEHRILFPRLLFWSDYAWMGGTGIPDVLATLAIQAAAAALYARLAWMARRGDPARAAWAALPFILLFSLRQEENFAWSFQTQFVGVFAVASASVALGVAAAGGEGPVLRPAMAGALALQVVAAFTMGNGFLAGLATAAVLALRRRRACVLPAAVALACLAAYVHGFERPEGSPPLSRSLDHPLVVAAFALAYLGSFLHPYVPASAALGLVGVVALATLAWRVATGRERDPSVVAMLGIATFVAASAVVTALGRSSNDFDEATASRYATGAATFWSVTLPCLASSLGPRARIGAAMAGALAAASVAGDVPGLREMRMHAYLRSSDADAAVLGILDMDAFHRDESGEGVADGVAMMRERGIGPFAGRLARLPGSPLSAAGRDTGADCPEALAATSRPSLGPDAVVLAGKDPVRTFLPGPRRVFVADASGRVAGLGSAGPAMGGGWTGYARARPGESLTAYAASDLGRLCRLGTVPVAPPG